MTLFAMKEKIYAIEQEIIAVRDEITKCAADATFDIKGIGEKEENLKNLEKRLELLKADHDREEAKQRLELSAMQKMGSSEENTLLKAKANFYKAVLMGGDVKKAYEGLGALPANSADLGRGEHLLPSNISTTLITEPTEENSLRLVEPVSQITGLEEPILTFNIEEADLADVTDKDTAKEIELSGGSIVYGRNKTKISATVKDTVLHGTETDLVTSIENGLRSGLAIKEKMNAFRATATNNSDTDRQSFYLNDIKVVTGSDIIAAITNAWADLPDAFASRASVVMRKSDYYSAIRTLANSDNLWGKKPEDVLGIPVVFNDRAVYPVVGDFSYSRQNYDIGTIYESDKDVKKGEYYFVLTAWGDHRIRLKSAFRIAKVATTTGS